ncbi:MAG: PKD domain-containing protein, partial [Verrucomicrobiia bacterium]
MDFLRTAGHTPQQLADSESGIPSARRFGLIRHSQPRPANQGHGHSGVWALVLALGLVMGAVSSQAQINYTWVGGSDYWGDPNAWNPTGPPGANNNAFFTNAATYYVTLTNNVSIATNFFSNASNTIATVTLDLGTNHVTNTALTNDTFVVGETAGSTSIVYIASSTQGQGGLVDNGPLAVGGNGVGILYVTNGYVALGTGSDPGLTVGEGTNSRGTLVISGTNTYFNNGREFTVGTPGSYGNSVVVSNSASITISSSFRMGSSSDGGSSNNTFILDSGAHAAITGGHATIGKRSSTATGSYNNSMIVQSNAVCTFGGSFFIGWDSSGSSGDTGPGPATNNVLTVGAGGTVSSTAGLAINGSNTLNLAGGSFQAGTITCSGTIQGYGTLTFPGKYCIVSSNGFFNPLNSVGQLTISGSSLSFSAGSTTTVQLGTNFNTTAMTGKLYLTGTLNFTDSGGFTNGTYTLFTSTGTMSTSGLTIGTTPNTNLTYSLLVNTSTSNQLDLVVAPFPVASFTGSPTNGTAPSTVTFTDTSIGTITNWNWTLGDGTTTNTTTNTLRHTYNAGTYNIGLTIWAYGGSSTSTQFNYIVVANPPPPVAGFTGSPTIGVAPLGVTFTDASTGSITNWYWNFGDGSTTNFGVETDPVHTYAAGTYAVTLIATGYGGSGTSIQSNYIVSAAPPVASFTGSPTNGTAPLAVTFTDTSVGVITNWNWNLGDGTTTNTTTSSLSHTYNAGTYTVSLTIWAYGGSSTNTLSNYIVATNPPPPVAGFTASPTNGPVPLAVTFTDASTGAITNWFWSFGDSNTTNTTTTGMSHTYSNAGTYTVGLTVSGYGGSGTSTRTDYIVAVNPPNLVVNPGSLTYGGVTVGQTSSLNFSVINSGQQTLTGSVATASPFLIAGGSPYIVAGGQTATVSVAFTPVVAGSFGTNVIFASNGGASTNTVSGTGLTAGNIAVNPASYSFGMLATGTTAQTTLVVTNSGGTAVSNGTASVSGPFTIVSGATFSVAGFGTTNVVVQFAPVAAGGFTNSVIYTSANGGAATNTVSGMGAIAPVALFTGSPTNGTAPLAVTFTDNSTGTITNRAWDFGDGTTTNFAVATNPTHTYAAGTYTVGLTVSGPLGTSNQISASYVVASIGGGYALAFDGNQNYAQSAATANIDQLQHGTLECWVRFTNSPPGGSVIMAQTDDWHGDGNGWYMRVDGDQAWEFDWANGDVINMSLTGQHLYDGNWHHLAVTYAFDLPGTGTFSGWTDGELTGGSGGWADPVTTGVSSILLGAAWNLSGSGGPQQFSQAIIDEVRISDTNLYTTTFAPVPCLDTNEYSLAYYTMDTPVTASLFEGPNDVAVDANGNVYVTDAGNTIRRVTQVGANWITSTVAGLAGASGNTDGTNNSAEFNRPKGIAVDNSGNLYVTDTGNNAVRKITPTGTNWVTTTIASGFNSPQGIAVDGNGNLYVTDTGDSTIVEITPAGMNWATSTIAGLAGNFGSADGTNSNARFWGPVDIAVDGSGNLYVADEDNHAVRKITPSGTNWVTTTISSAFNSPQGIAADSSGNLYVVDTELGSVTKLTPSGTNWVASTVASDFNWPQGIAVDSSNNLYVADQVNTTVVRIAPVGTDWIESTIAGLVQVPGNGDNLTAIPDVSGNNLWLLLYGNPAPSLVTGVCVLPPTASFTASPTNGPWPLIVTFTDTSGGTVTNRSWNLGDGTSTNNTDGRFLHTYATAGTNTVSLTVSGPLGSSSLTLTNYIVVVNPSHLVVNPGSLSYGSVTIGQTNSLSFSVINTGDITLTGTAASSEPFTVTSGGSYSVDGGQTATVTVAFAPGTATTFNDTVIFTSNGGDSANTVNGTGLTPGNIAASPASYDFGTMTTGTLAQTTLVVTNTGGTVVSNGTASVSGPFTIVSGATFSVAGFGTTNVVVQFAPVAAGGFTNSVIFTSANGGTATDTVSGTGAIVPVALFTGSPINGPAPLAVTFTDDSTGTITNRFWNFGDGTTTNTMATSLSYTYNSAGIYTVSLIVSGPVGVSTNTQASYILVITPAQLGVNPGSLNYSVVTVGQTNGLNFSVINFGQQTLTGAVATASPFLIASGSPYTVAGGQTQ